MGHAIFVDLLHLLENTFDRKRISIKHYPKRPSVKDVRNQGEGVCPVRTRGKGSSSDADVRTFGAKTFGFFEVYDVFIRTKGEGGWASADILRIRGERVNFRHLVRTSFMDGP